MDKQKSRDFINQLWDDSIIPALMAYIKIPNKSPLFDPDWKANGFMEKAVHLIADWCRQQAVENMTIEVIYLPGRTPVILMDIPGQSDATVLLYGHLDKQPEMTGWAKDLHPWQPTLQNDRLYGRGAADDGYAAFAAVTALRALRHQHIPHARCIILIESCEESGSYDLPFYIEALKQKIGKPDLVICLDSGCGNYDQLWITTSLRGLVGGTLSITTLKEGVHSGSASGVVPSCFRILRQLLSRIENEETGNIKLSDLSVEIPAERSLQATQVAAVLKKSIFNELPIVTGLQPESGSLAELILRRTWKPALSITGAEGMPSLAQAGNVTLPQLTVKLSMRLPPTCDAQAASYVLKSTLEKNPPQGAKVQFEVNEAASGWDAPVQKTWLTKAAHEASSTYFGDQAVYMGEGGSIPFMGMLGKKYPEAQFLITGVLGPESNAHGPNEFLHIPTAKKLTACIAAIIKEHYESLRLSK